jgi:hypothetical protein
MLELAFIGRAKVMFYVADHTSADQLRFFNIGPVGFEAADVLAHIMARVPGVHWAVEQRQGIRSIFLKQVCL